MPIYGWPNRPSCGSVLRGKSPPERAARLFALARRLRPAKQVRSRVCHTLSLGLKPSGSVFMEKRYHWKLKQREIVFGERTLIMGILNVTPNSFSDGGEYSDPDRAFARAIEIEEQGADINDIGAESTKPGSARISEAEELRRLVPVLKRLKGKLSVPTSVDTYKAGIAEKAFEFGVEIINDPSGLTFDADLAKKVANANAGLILNHMRGTPETWAK